MSTARRSSAGRGSREAGPALQDHLNVVHPDVGKRYRLNFSGEVNRLSVGKIKHCLATASSCAIPVDKMVLKMNGVPLSDDRDICGALGIQSGTTLSVEHIKHVEPFLHRHVDAYGHDTVLDHMGSYISPKRRQLEVHTVKEQEVHLQRDLEAQERILQGTIANMDEELYETRLRKQKLERSRTLADQKLSEINRREEQTIKEKQRLAKIMVEEEARAAQRAADLENRREKLRQENEAMQSIAMQKLALEEHKAKLAEEKAQFKAEQMKIEQEQEMFENLAKEREARILAQELELEHAQLSQARQRQELEVQRRIAMEQKIHYYRQLGIPGGSPGEDNSVHSGGGFSPRVVPTGNIRRGSMSYERTDIPHRRASYGEPDDLGRKSTEAGGGEMDQGMILEQTSSSPLAYPEVTRSSNDVLTARMLAQENLRQLGNSLQAPVPLEFDLDNTCAFTVDRQYSLLVSLDEPCERLFLYATLVTEIPTENANLCLQLFTFLLEGLQPGVDRSASGLSASFHVNSIILSVSIHLPSSQPWALAVVTPSFVQCLQEWRTKIAAFMHHRMTSTPSPQKNSSPLLGLEVTDTLIVNGISTPCNDGGVIVVSSSGSAAAAGMERNDWIKHVDGQLITSKEMFYQLVHHHFQQQLQEPIEIEFERGGVSMKVSVFPQ